MAKRNKDYKNRHHIIPRSRGGGEYLENICMVNAKDHDTYHQLFGNRTPEEIVNYLVTEFWNNDYTYVQDAMERYYYGSS